LVKSHCQRVAFYSARVAKRLGMDPKLAYMSGIYHDIGKLVINFDLFSERDITNEEFSQIKEHPKIGSEVLKDIYLLTSLISGLYHAMSKNGGYGITMQDIPAMLCPHTVQLILNMAMIVSVCDFIDAYSTRKTKLRDSATVGKSLRELLEERFQNFTIINEALRVTGA
jgi:putative nucleotidyltransferase with HDIG domain